MVVPTYDSVRVFSCEEFKRHDFTPLGANLHVHPTGNSFRLVIFVHGWSGQGYDSWGSFPQMLFDEELDQKIDVLVFDFKSGRRKFLSGGADLPAVSMRLTRIIQELSRRYSSISIITHSTGGIIAEDAVANYLKKSVNDGSIDSRSVVNCFVHFDAPRAGTGLARPGLSRFQREFRWLARFSDKVTEIQAFYTDNVQVNAVEQIGHYIYYLPRFVVIAEGDLVVSTFSSTYGVNSSQVVPLSGTHGSIVKPDLSKPEAADIALARILLAENLQYEVARQQYQAVQQQNVMKTREIITVEFWSIADKPHLSGMYNNIRRQLSTDRFTLQDVTEVADLEADPVRLLISTSDAKKLAVRGNLEVAKVERALTRRSESPQLSLAIAMLGESATVAQAIVEEIVEAASIFGYLELATAVSDVELEKTYIGWLENLINRDPTRQAMRSRAERVIELDETPEESIMNGRFL